MQGVIRLIDFINRICDEVEPKINTHLHIQFFIFNSLPTVQFSYRQANNEKVGYAYSIDELELSNTELMQFRATKIAMFLIEPN